MELEADPLQDGPDHEDPDANVPSDGERKRRKRGSSIKAQLKALQRIVESNDPDDLDIPESYKAKVTMSADLFREYSMLCSQQRKVTEMLAMMFESIGKDVQELLDKRKQPVAASEETAQEISEPVHKKPRGKSAYNLFSEDRRQVLKEQHKDLKPSDLMKMLAEEWKALPEEEREGYEQRAEVSKQQAKAARDEEKEAKKEAEKQAEALKRRQKKVKSVSGYIVFGRERRQVLKDEQPALKPPEIMKRLGQEWKAMSDAEKAEYQGKADRETSKLKHAAKSEAAGFDLFSKKHAQMLKRSQPDGEDSVVEGILAARWESLEESERRSYISRAVTGQDEGPESDDEGAPSPTGKQARGPAAGETAAARVAETTREQREDADGDKTAVEEKKQKKRKRDKGKEGSDEVKGSSEQKKKKKKKKDKHKAEK